MFIKTKHILVNRGQIKGVLFGSSRGDSINIRSLIGNQYYNYSYPTGVPEEFLEDMKDLYNMGVDLKQIIVSVDEIMFKVDVNARNNNVETFSYSSKHIPKIKKYLKFLFFNPSINRLFFYRDEFLSGKKKNFDIKSGCIFVKDRDKKIDENLETYKLDEKFTEPMRLESSVIDDISRPNNAIKEIIAFCREHGIELTIFISPTHPTTYFDLTNQKLIQNLRETLIGMTNYWDFSGINSVAINNANYYDTSHYRLKIGDMILGRIFGIKDIIIPDDFGVYVTKENFEQHIIDIETNDKQYIDKYGKVPINFHKE